MSTSTFALGTRYFIIDFLGGIAFFPLWWYTRGLALVLSWAGHSVSNQAKDLALGVWVKNLFVPMYGMTDWAARLISFVLRLVMIIGRGLLVLVWLMLLLVVVTLYLCMLPFAVVGSLYHLYGVLG